MGGTGGTAAILSTGGSTIANVEFANNAGFDWNLYHLIILFHLLDNRIWALGVGSVEKIQIRFYF